MKSPRKMVTITLSPITSRLLHDMKRETGLALGVLIDQAVDQAYGTDGPIVKRVQEEVATMRESLKAEIFNAIQERERAAAVAAGLDPDRASRLFPVK